MNQVSSEQLLRDAEAALTQADTLQALEAWHVKYFSRENGEINALLRAIPQLPPAERGTVGKAINQGKQALEKAYTERHEALSAAAIEQRLRAERVDVTLPSRRVEPGRPHPVKAVMEEMLDIFAQFGFEVTEGPEVEDEWHNFTALNTPAEHPSRDMQDTFYLAKAVPGALLLRTQTSAVQIREMEKRQAPLRIVAPGRVYRRDEITKRHYPVFHQLEMLMVEEGTTMAHLKGVLTAFAQALFGPERRTRFRPSYFPFTEPSVELDVDCPFCAGKGCGTCSYSGWIELGGAGMVHPNVLEAVNYDSKKLTGLAFGLGVDRIAMIRYGINDIRHLWENDVRFLQQF